jgi:hypothetical protein
MEPCKLFLAPHELTMNTNGTFSFDVSDDH